MLVIQAGRLYKSPYDNYIQEDTMLNELLQLHQQTLQDFNNADAEHYDDANEALRLAQLMLDAYVKLQRIYRGR